MTEESRKVVAAALAVMALRFRERLSLKELAAGAGASPSHLCRVFRKAHGSTVHQHLLRLRVAASVRPVLEGADLTRLAFETGFASHSHFTATFRRVYGFSPSQFRTRGSRSAASRRAGAEPARLHSSSVADDHDSSSTGRLTSHTANETDVQPLRELST